MTYDFYCKKHGYFERMFMASGTKETECLECGEMAEQVWIEAPQIDGFAARLWNTPYGDKSKLAENLKRTGRFVKEPGIEEDAKRNEQYYLDKLTDKLDKKIEQWVKERPVEMLKQAVESELAVQQAIERKDIRALRAMGAPTLKEMEAESGKLAPVEVLRTDRRNRERK